jgi:hypothetical protein
LPIMACSPSERYLSLVMFFILLYSDKGVLRFYSDASIIMRIE